MPKPTGWMTSKPITLGREYCEYIFIFDQCAKKRIRGIFSRWIMGIGVLLFAA
jgi:hypothetical protein